MGFIGSLLGKKSGAGFTAKAAPIMGTTDQSQLANAQAQEQQAMGMQSSLAQQLAGQGGLQNQNDVFAQQQGLANQLGQMAQGGGPNPALAQFQQATGQNVANQAALMGSQRGAGANVGLMARQAAQQGAGIEQGAAGQLAAQQAQQQLNATQMLQNQQAQMGGMANQQVANQMQGVGQLGQMAQAGQNAQLGAAGQLNQAQISNTQQQNSANAEIAKQNASHQGGLLGGLLGGIGTAIGGPLGGMAGKAIGGMFGGSGQPAPIDAGLQGSVDNGGMSTAGGAMQTGTINSAHGGLIPRLASQGGHVDGRAKVDGDNSKNDTVPTMLSPGEIVIPRSIAQHPEAPSLAAEFVRHAIARGPQHKSGYFDAGEVGENDDEEAASSPDLENVIAQKPANDPYQGMSAQSISATPGGSNVSEVGFKSPETQSAFAQSPTAMNDLSKSFDTMEDQMRAKAKTEGQLGYENSKIFSGVRSQESAQAKDYNQSLANADKEYQSALEDFKNDKIDPSRYLGNMGTGQKVSTAIGLIIGGMGGGLTGQENPASKFLNQQIQNDLEAQKSNLGKKENLISMNLKHVGNLKDAYQMAHAQMLDMAELQLKQHAAETQNPLAAQNANIEIAKLQMQKAQILAPIQQKAQAIQALHAGTIAPEQAFQYIANSPADKEKLLNEATSREYIQQHLEHFNQLWDKAQSSNTLIGGTIANAGRETPEYAQFKTELRPIVKKITGFRNLDAIDSVIDGFAPHKGRRDSTQLMNKDAMNDFFSNDNIAPTMKSYQIDPNKLPQTAIDPISTSGLSPVLMHTARVAEQRIQQNPNDVNALNFLHKNVPNYKRSK